MSRSSSGRSRNLGPLVVIVCFAEGAGSFASLSSEGALFFKCSNLIPSESECARWSCSSTFDRVVEGEDAMMRLDLRSAFWTGGLIED
jgi:hypothetical protein